MPTKKQLQEENESLKRVYGRRCEEHTKLQEEIAELKKGIDFLNNQNAENGVKYERQKECLGEAISRLEALDE